MSLRERHEQILDNCVESLKSWKELIAEYLDGEEKTAELEKLQQVAKDYCDLDSMFQRSMKVIQKVEEQLNEDETPSKDVQKLYEGNLKKDLEAPEENYKDSDVWQRIFRGVSDVMEVTQKERVIDESEFEDLGDSMLCSNVFAPPIDPISKTVIRNPYKNKRCKHIYEYATIVSYIRQLKRKAKCPYIGCKNNRLLMDDLVKDDQLRVQITQYIESQCDEESQGEEDVL
ncbi:hypothetical protein NQ318_002799 [Aromia moschata]|uniref:E3 SUMO-protein ligase NSE2 n=1 Tax=Aromia moschata TaxID=1265417 RepID=A0AAV8XTP0_9CUCU|nr:hypothetical protein NQ318_002799 [Aromia moschata]